MHDNISGLNIQLIRSIPLELMNVDRLGGEILLDELKEEVPVRYGMSPVTVCRTYGCYFKLLSITYWQLSKYKIRAY